MLSKALNTLDMFPHTTLYQKKAKNQSIYSSIRWGQKSPSDINNITSGYVETVLSLVGMK